MRQHEQRLCAAVANSPYGYAVADLRQWQFQAWRERRGRWQRWCLVLLLKGDASQDFPDYQPGESYGVFWYGATLNQTFHNLRVVASLLNMSAFRPHVLKWHSGTSQRSVPTDFDVNIEVWGD